MPPDIIQTQKVEISKFIQYCNDSYNGGKEGLRCTECDRKYRGESAIVQLCPVCQAKASIAEAIANIGRELEARCAGVDEGEALFENDPDKKLSEGYTIGYNAAIDRILTLIRSITGISN
jgi:hypothetical protein